MPRETNPTRSHPPDQLWTTAQVAEFLQVSERSVRRLVKDEKLPVVYVLGLPRFRAADVRDAFRPQ